MVSVCVSLCVCVQSKVSNNVSGRMCLAIEIYLHYYSVLTMRLGSSIPPVPYCSPTVYQSPRTVFDLRSRCLDLWVARQLVKPCLRQHGQACTQRQHLSRWLLSRSSSLCALLFPLQSALLCSLLLVLGLQSLAGIAFKLQLPRFDSSSLSICKMSIYSSASIQV